MHGKRYYREVSRLRGNGCPHDGRSVRVEVPEEQIGELMQRLHLPDDWQQTTEDIFNGENTKPARKNCPEAL